MTASGQDKTVQGRWWSAVAVGRTSTHGSLSVPVYESIFARATYPPSAPYLDVGCGSGEGCALALEKGLEVHGVDPSDAMISAAKLRSPDAAFELGSAEQLGFADARFSLVTAINSLHFCAQPERAFRECHRVLARQGELAVNCLCPRELSEVANVFGALLALVPLDDKTRVEFADPYRLAAVGVVEALLRTAGFTEYWDYYIDLPFEFPDVDAALRSYQNIALYAAATACLGKQACDDALRAAVMPFVRPDGGVRFVNAARVVFARKT